MKKLINLFATLSILAITAFTVSAQQSVPTDIEARIDQAFARSFEHPEALPQQIAALEAMQPEDNYSVSYWLAYAHYQHCIALMSKEEKKAAEKAIKKAVRLLDDLADKDSEALALHSSAVGLSINFSMWRAPFLGSEAEGLARKAIEKDPENPRAYLALARNSYYKPAMFGGGDEVEENLLKAISLAGGNTATDNSPTWGMPEAYYLLAKFYQSEEQTEQAKLYALKGAKKYPEDYRLAKLSKKYTK